MNRLQDVWSNGQMLASRLEPFEYPLEHSLDEGREIVRDQSIHRIFVGDAVNLIKYEWIVW